MDIIQRLGILKAQIIELSCSLESIMDDYQHIAPQPPKAMPNSNSNENQLLQILIEQNKKETKVMVIISTVISILALMIILAILFK